MLLLFFPLITWSVFVSLLHIHHKYHIPQYPAHQRAAAGLSVSFLFCCMYLLSLKYLHLCMSLILIPSYNYFVILEIIIAWVRWGIVCEANNQSKMCSEISSNCHLFSFPHLRNFSNHLHISFLIYTTNTIVFLPNTISHISALFIHFHIHDITFC
jgi:hypothetical protein